MSRYLLAEPARHDIATILADSAKHFGEVASERYELLIATALVDLASNPECPGSRATLELGAGSRLYHLRNSRGRAGSSGSKVSNPRHFILYKVIASGVVGIARLLHDSMDLSRHATDDFGQP